MREIESTVDPALANPVAMIAFVAKQYIDYVDRRWDELEQKFSSFLLAVTRFKETMDFMLRVRRDVAYALDGWAPLIAHWDAVAEDDGPVRAAALLHILDNTPVMPEGELDPCPESKVMAQYEAARTHVVKAMTGWGTNKVDAELQERLERARQRTDDAKAAGIRPPG